VLDDPAPQLGGNLDTNGHGIIFTKLTNAQYPVANPSANAVYGAEPGAGGTGIRFTTYSTSSGIFVQDEFVSRRKSILHALIFG
jgi:hypothetical protein